MKKVSIISIIILMLLSFSGCTFPLARPMPLGTGVVYSNVTFSDDNYPMKNAVVGNRKGEASMSSILCCFTFGNASVIRAAQNEGISKITTVEHSYFNLLLIYQSYTTTVTGERE